MNNNYSYLIGTTVLLIAWFILFIINPRSRKKMLSISLLTTPFGLTEPIFVPYYWQPYTLFNLAGKTGFDIESLLFSFAIGGVAAILHEALLKTRREKISIHEQHQKKHKFHRFALVSPLISFTALYLLLPINPIYSSIIAMIIGVITTGYCRPDLIKPMLVGSVLFLTLYFLVFSLSFVWLFPGSVETVWNLPKISGILILGIPIEELLFAASLGAMWSSLYEHLAWHKLS